MLSSHKWPAEDIKGQASLRVIMGKDTVLGLKPEEKKPSQTEKLAALSLEGWGWGVSASLWGGGKVFGSFLSQIAIWI